MLVDLTQPFADGMHSLPGWPRVTLAPFTKIEEYGLQDTKVEFCVHSGTHIDAPSHADLTATTADKIPLEDMTGMAVCWSFRGKESREEITVDELEQQSPKLERGDFLFIDTGWAAHFWDEDLYARPPVLSLEAAKWLMEQGIRMIATDTRTPERSPGPRQFPIHSLYLDNGILIAENLANLDKVAGQRFRVFAFAIPMVGADGAPARFVADL